MPRIDIKPLEAVRGKEEIPYWLQREHGPDDTFISEFYLAELKAMNFYYFKPLNLWYFVMAALRN
jgi:hypothetical protein